MLCYKRSHCKKKKKTQVTTKSSPPLSQLEKTYTQQQRPNTAKKKQINRGPSNTSTDTSYHWSRSSGYVCLVLDHSDQPLLIFLPTLCVQSQPQRRPGMGLLWGLLTSESVTEADKESHRSFKSWQSNIRDQNLGFFFFFFSHRLQLKKAWLWPHEL